MMLTSPNLLLLIGLISAANVAFNALHFRRVADIFTDDSAKAVLPVRHGHSNATNGPDPHALKAAGGEVESLNDDNTALASKNRRMEELRKKRAPAAEGEKHLAVHEDRSASLAAMEKEDNKGGSAFCLLVKDNDNDILAEFIAYQ